VIVAHRCFEALAVASFFPDNSANQKHVTGLLPFVLPVKSLTINDVTDVSLFQRQPSKTDSWAKIAIKQEINT